MSLGRRRKALPGDGDAGGGRGRTRRRLPAGDARSKCGKLETAIGALPDGARDALVLHALYGYSHGEAAEMLGIAEGTCKAQLHRPAAVARATEHGDQLDMNGPEERKVKSLGELPVAIEPPRDLWPGIEARLRGARGHGGCRAGPRPAGARLAQLRWLAAAAMVASVAVGVWIGREVLPLSGGAATAPQKRGFHRIPASLEGRGAQRQLCQ